MKSHTLPVLLLIASLARGGSASPVTGDSLSEPARGPQGLHRALQPAGPYADPGIDVTSYDLDLRLPPAQPFLYGRVTAHAIVIAGPKSSLSLDLASAMTVDSVLVGLQRAFFSRPVNGLVVDLPSPVPAGQAVAVTVVYHGVPDPTGFGSFIFSERNSGPWIWTLSEPYGARDWWPCKDNMTDKADSVHMRLTCLSGLKVGSNGVLVSSRDNPDGTQTVEWAERYPIAAYLVSLTIGNCVEFTDWFRYSPADSMPVVNYLFPDALAAAKPVLSLTPSMLGIFSSMYGLYPFIGEKYGHTQIGWGGAMEHQTMTSMTSFNELTIAHELAHQWFGDMITCGNWQSIWLNEGFATYSEALYLERQYGAAEGLKHMQDMMSRAMLAQGSIFVEDTSAAGNIFNYNRSYAKAAWVLHMLRYVVGDSAFFRGMRAYAGDPALRYRSATTGDFQRVMETASGRPLGFFFDEWIFGEGYPTFRPAWSRSRSGGKYTLRLTITQTTPTANPPAFATPLDVRFESPAGDTTVTVFVSSAREDFEFVLDRDPSGVAIDPDHRLLRTVLSPLGVLPAEFALSSNYPNPFNPGTAIDVEIPHRSAVSVGVYDLSGRLVARLAEGTMEPGRATLRWDGRDDRGMEVSSGTYICRLTSEGVSLTTKMVLLR
jgi:aminopeptidase N